MSDSPEGESHHRPHTSPLAAPFLDFDLPAEVHRLHAEATWSTGQNARTLIKYDNFRVVLTALQANVRVAEHKTDGRVSVHVLSGPFNSSPPGERRLARRGRRLPSPRYCWPDQPGCSDGASSVSRDGIDRVARHRAVSFAALLTVLATVVLLLKMAPTSYLAGAVAQTALSNADLRAVRIELVAHAGGGLVLLLVATVLSVFRPWGMTEYGRRKQRADRALQSP